MGFYMHLFGRANEPVAQHARTLFIADIMSRDPRATPVLTGDGVGWASFGLSCDPGVTGAVPAADRDPHHQFLDLQISTRTDLVKSFTEVYSADGGPDLSWCDISVEITLGGRGVDRPLVRAVWVSAMALWSAVPHVDGRGFGVTLDDLPS
jgi:hypothetical protein